MAETTLLNIANFLGDYGAETGVEFSSSEASTIILDGLTATKTANKEYWVDGPLLYTIVVTNTTDEIFSNGVFTDVLDNLIDLDETYGVRVNGTIVPHTYVGKTVRVENLPNIAATSGTLTITFQVIKA